jgi:hypothetical protein
MVCGRMHTFVSFNFTVECLSNTLKALTIYSPNIYYLPKFVMFMYKGKMPLITEIENFYIVD